MTSRHSEKYVLCMAGARVINKRMAMFCEGLQASGLAVRLWSLPRGPWVLDKSEAPTIVHRLSRWSADLGDLTGRRLSAVLCFHWSVLPLAVILGLIRRVPVLYDEHDHYELNTLEGSGPRWKRALSGVLVRGIHRCFLPWVTLVTCIHQDQQTLKRHLERWQPAVMELHNYPARIWRQCGELRNPAGPLCFVYIGGVYREKGVGAAADAFLQLPKHLKQQSELHIFGEGDRVLIEELQERGGITVHRGVTPEQFRAFAATRRCCGLALLAGTPRYRLVGTNCTKLYEYLALGMPVIATRVGEFPRQVLGDRVGLLIDAEMPISELSAAMTRLIAEPELFGELSGNALRLMSRPEMTWEHEWSRVEQSGVMSGNRRAA